MRNRDNNPLIQCCIENYVHKKKHIITTQTEHKCVLDSGRALQQEGFDVTYLPVQKDGLIDKNKGYSIEWKNGGELYINGKKQTKEISDKYKKYYKKDGWRIEMNGHGDKGGEFLTGIEGRVAVDYSGSRLLGYRGGAPRCLFVR